MRTAWRVYVDDLPDYILAGFGEVRRITGRYPTMLIVGPLLAEMMGGKSVGVWRPCLCRHGCGVWAWSAFLHPGDVRRTDEYGQRP